MKNFKKDFPIFASHPRLVYLDSAATSQKPKAVIDSITKFYSKENANIHRGIYSLSENATESYNHARKTVANFLNTDSDNIIFVRNATEAINLVAFTYGETLSKNDTVLVTLMEHHANFVPWQQLQKRKQLKLDIVGLNSDQTLNLKELDKKLALKPKLLCVTQVSNAIGTINPIEQIIKKAHAVGTKVLIDGSQSAPHMAIDLKKLNPDFFVCTGHKMLGPMGIGVLMMKKEIADNIPPFLTGGDMISQVSAKETTFLPSPQKFEAGTPNVSGAIGLATAIDYMEKIGMKKIRDHEKNLFNKAWKILSKQKDIRLFGPENPDHHAGIISFTMDGAHPHDIAQIFDANNIAIRAGNHCCQPLINSLGIPATARISFHIYNDENDIQKVLDALAKVRKIFV